MHPIIRCLAPLVVAALVPLGCGGEEPVSTVELPRPLPPATIDQVARSVITQYGDRVAETPDSAAFWLEYGDVCLMNLWPDEAIVAYGEALGTARPLPPETAAKTRWRLAHAHHEVGDHVAADREGVAAIAAIAERTPFPDGWLTVAARRLDQGDLDGADEAMAKSTNAMPMRRAIVSVQLDVQQGRIEDARATVDAMIEGEVAPATASRLAVLVGQVQNDRDLVEAHQDRAANVLVLPDDPILRALGGKAVHVLADLQRCLLWSESLPPRQALQRMRPILGRRPGSASVRMLVADQLRKLKQFEEAKKVLDAVYEDDPPDHEYWSVDALVHLELSRQDDPGLRERARDSIDRAIRINPTLAYGWQIKAFIHEADEQWAFAADAYRKAAELASRPEDAESWNQSADECAVKAEAP